MPRRRYPQSGASRQNLTVVVVLVSLLTASTFIFIGLLLKSPEEDIQPYQLVEIINLRGRIGRGELQLIKKMPPNVRKEDVFKDVGQPMARLKDLENKQLGVLQQYAYPLAFDPQTQIVLLFKSDRLLAYQFVFNGNIPRD